MHYDHQQVNPTMLCTQHLSSVHEGDGIILLVPASNQSPLLTECFLLCNNNTVYVVQDDGSGCTQNEKADPLAFQHQLCGILEEHNYAKVDDDEIMLQQTSCDSVYACCELEGVSMNDSQAVHTDPTTPIDNLGPSIILPEAKSAHELNGDNLDNNIEQSTGAKDHDSDVAGIANASDVELIASIQSPAKPAENDYQCNTSMGTLEQLSRDALKLATNPTGCREELESMIMRLQQSLRGSNSSNANYHRYDPEPRINEDGINRIKELFPPDGFSAPRYSSSGFRCMIPSAVETPLRKTLRAAANFAVQLSQDSGDRYNTCGDYFKQEAVNYLPVPSIWTPQHALMPAAPCISSPAFYQSCYPNFDESLESEDSDEQFAIY